MIITQKMKIVAHTKKYVKDSPSLTEGESVDITLELSEGEIGLFLFKFATDTFSVGDYKVAFSNTNGRDNIAFFKDDDIYIIVNPQQFLSELLDGYERIRFNSRLQHLFDIENEYWTAETNYEDEPVDEFDTEETEEPEKMDDSVEEVHEEGINVVRRQNGEWVDPIVYINRFGFGEVSD